MASRIAIRLRHLAGTLPLVLACFAAAAQPQTRAGSRMNAVTMLRREACTTRQHAAAIASHNITSR